MGVKLSQKDTTALFQEGFAISGKEFRSRNSVGGCATILEIPWEANAGFSSPRVDTAAPRFGWRARLS